MRARHLFGVSLPALAAAVLAAFGPFAQLVLAGPSCG